MTPYKTPDGREHRLIKEATVEGERIILCQFASADGLSDDYVIFGEHPAFVAGEHVPSDSFCGPDLVRAEAAFSDRIHNELYGSYPEDVEDGGKFCYGDRCFREFLNDPGMHQAASVFVSDGYMQLTSCENILNLNLWDDELKEFVEVLTEALDKLWKIINDPEPIRKTNVLKFSKTYCALGFIAITDNGRTLAINDGWSATLGLTFRRYTERERTNSLNKVRRLRLALARLQVFTVYETEEALIEHYESEGDDGC